MNRLVRWRGVSMRNKLQYRLYPADRGWKIQVKRFFLWWNVSNVGPFGTNHSWFTIEGAQDMLYAQMKKSAFNMKDNLRTKRINMKNKSIGPIMLSDSTTNRELKGKY
jgi:hypothetical protein